MLEKNKDYTIFTEYKDGKPQQLQVYKDKRDFQYWFRIDNVYRSNIFADFFNNCYSLHKDAIDNTLKEIESGNKDIKFECNEYGIISYSDYFEFIIYAPNNLDFCFFEDFYTIRDDWEKVTIANKEIISVKKRIQAFKDHYRECYKKIGIDKELDDFKDRGIFIPVLFEKNNELHEYLMFINYIYYGYEDSEMDIYYYDCKNNKIYEGTFPYGNDAYTKYTLFFKPYHKIDWSQEGIENWYSLYESLISLYYHDRESFYFLYDEYIDFLKKVTNKKFSKYVIRKMSTKFKPLKVHTPGIVDGKKIPYKEYIDK